MNLIHSKRIGALLGALVLAAAGCGGGSSSTTTTVPGTLYGTVKKGTSVASGVAVSAAGLATTTASDGSYSLGVPPGTYSVSFTGDGVEPATANDVSVVANGRTKLDQTLTASQLVVTVNLPESAVEGQPVGFGTTVGGITVTAKLNGATVGPDSVTWSIKDNVGLGAPPTAATPSPATGATTSFDVGTFDEVVAGANTWMSTKYGETFPYIRVPERYELVSFSAQQVLAMSYMVRATVKVGSRTTTGSALVSPVTVSNGGNYQPKGLMVVAGAPEADSYAWVLEYISPTSTSPAFGAAPEGVTLSDPAARNPYFLPTVSGVYRLTNASSSIYLRVSTFHGVGKSDQDQGTDGQYCGSCHGVVTEDGVTTDHTLYQFGEWINSAHANHNYKDPLATSMPLVQFELSDTSPSNHYRESCLECHTVGYSKVPTADNKGFDDAATAAAWSFPTSYGPEAWATVSSDPAMLHRASIQCENCHGPLEPLEHAQPQMNPAMWGMPLAPKASMSAAVCTVCHDEQPYHDRGSLWAASGHANLELAIEEGVTSASCARCHSAEGFMLYLPRQQAGTPGNLADISSLSAATVHSQTCQTCHDPHKTTLRVSGDTKQVAGMFSVANAGNGALCIVCHNSRSGAIKQGTYTISSWSRLGPHAACQGDMFAGRNAFFVANLTASDAATSLPNLSAHAFMADTCVDCHVKWVPPDIQAQFGIRTDNHTFRSSTQVCAECHAADIGERIQESVQGKMDTLTGRLGTILAAKLTMTAGFDTAAGARTNPDTGAAIADPTSRTVLPATVEAIVAVPSTDAVIVRLTDGSKFQVGLDKVYTVGTTTALLDLTNATVQTVGRAYFNLLYVNNDGAKGIHNPAFAAKVLDGATAALNGVTLP